MFVLNILSPNILEVEPKAEDLQYHLKGNQSRDTLWSRLNCFFFPIFINSVNWNSVNEIPMTSWAKQNEESKFETERIELSIFDLWFILLPH